MTLVDLAPTLRSTSRLDALPVAIIGAGPVGLAAAAHLAARGLDFVVYEAGSTVASSVEAWRHIRLFSPWEHLIDPASRRLLEADGWTAPDPAAAPLAAELIDRYLLPLAAVEPIASRLRLGSTVLSVTREGMDRTRSAGRSSTPFQLRLSDSRGEVVEVLARAVIDASGTFSTPNSLGSNGLEPVGLAAVSGRVSGALPDVLGTRRAAFAGRRVAVVGAGHSAANTLIGLAELAREEPSTRISWVIRNAGAVRVVPSGDDELPGRASLGARVAELVRSGVITVVDGFEIDRVEADGAAIALVGRRHGAASQLTADMVVNATGFRPDLDMLREIRLDLDDVVQAPRRLAPLIDPNVHSCGTVEPHGFAELQQPEQGFFLAGMKSYGRAPTFLLATGYEQVRSITAWIDGDLRAASAVELSLPATGVCSTDPDSRSATACCS